MSVYKDMINKQSGYELTIPAGSVLYVENNNQTMIFLFLNLFHSYFLYFFQLVAQLCSKSLLLVKMLSYYQQMAIYFRR